MLLAADCGFEQGKEREDCHSHAYELSRKGLDRSGNPNFMHGIKECRA